jgi:ABC-type Fe3+ transport system permease subunit
MRCARRFIATITGIAIWCIATTTTAYALRPDPVGGDVPTPTPPPPPPFGTSLWQYLLVAAIAAVLTVAVVGLIASLRHARPSRTSRPSSILHA